MVTALSAAIATAWRFINTTSEVIRPSENTPAAPRGRAAPSASAGMLTANPGLGNAAGFRAARAVVHARERGLTGRADSRRLNPAIIRLARRGRSASEDGMVSLGPAALILIGFLLAQAGLVGLYLSLEAYRRAARARRDAGGEAARG
ncbi:MAG: hypothetical protein Kow00133_20970 [Amphiplicatus sp.]